MSHFVFDSNSPASQHSGDEVEFGSSVSLTLQKKPEKKAAVDRSPKAEKKAKHAPPELIQGKYFDIGPNLSALIRHRVRNEGVLQDMYNMAWQRATKKHGIGPAPRCATRLNSVHTPATDTTKAVTNAMKCKESDEGRKLLEEYRDRDNEARRVNDMFIKIKAYLKSTDCADLYEQWLKAKNPAIGLLHRHYARQGNR